MQILTEVYLNDGFKMVVFYCWNLIFESGIGKAFVEMLNKLAANTVIA